MSVFDPPPPPPPPPGRYTGGGGGGALPPIAHMGVCRSIGSILRGQFP